jgi:hypothetical protein
MTFTLEIAGRAIAITDADASLARELFGSDDFKDDLRSTESEGRPLWDGSAPFNIRASSSEEIEAFDDALNDDEEDGPAANEDEGDEDEGGINVVFLVPVDDMDGAPVATH